MLHIIFHYCLVLLVCKVNYITYMTYGNTLNFLDILIGMLLYTICLKDKPKLSTFAIPLPVIFGTYNMIQSNFHLGIGVVALLLLLCIYIYAKQYLESVLSFFISIEIYTSYFLHWWWQFLLILLMFLIAYKVAITYYNNNKLEGLLSPMLFALYSTAVVSCYKYKIVVENSWINFPFIFILAIIFPRYKIKNWLKTSFKKGFAVSTKR